MFVVVYGLPFCHGSILHEGPSCERAIHVAYVAWSSLARVPGEYMEVREPNGTVVCRFEE